MQIKIKFQNWSSVQIAQNVFLVVTRSPVFSLCLVWHLRSLEDTTPPNKYKSEQTEKLTTLLRSIREGRSQHTLMPPKTGETNRWIQRITTYWSSSLQGNQCWGRETWTVIDELLETQCGPLSELKTPGKPSHQEASTLLQVLPLGSLPGSQMLWSSMQKI